MNQKKKNAFIKVLTEWSLLVIHKSGGSRFRELLITKFLKVTIQMELHSAGHNQS